MKGLGWALGSTSSVLGCMLSVLWTSLALRAPSYHYDLIKPIIVLPMSVDVGLFKVHFRSKCVPALAQVPSRKWQPNMPDPGFTETVCRNFVRDMSGASLSHMVSVACRAFGIFHTINPWHMTCDGAMRIYSASCILIGCFIFAILFNVLAFLIGSYYFFCNRSPRAYRGFILFVALATMMSSCGLFYYSVFGGWLSQAFAPSVLDNAATHAGSGISWDAGYLLALASVFWQVFFLFFVVFLNRQARSLEKKKAAIPMDMTLVKRLDAIQRRYAWRDERAEEEEGYAYDDSGSDAEVESSDDPNKEFDEDELYTTSLIQKIETDIIRKKILRELWWKDRGIQYDDP